MPNFIPLQINHNFFKSVKPHKMNAASDRNNLQEHWAPINHHEDIANNDDKNEMVKFSESREGFKFAAVNWSELEVIPYEQLRQRRSANCRHAAHGMLYARTESKWQGYRQRAWILMQMRFDGCIGFPGGMVDDHDEAIEQLESALDREFREEAGLDPRLQFSRSEHVVTHYVPSWNIMLSFYCKEISVEQFLECERRTLQAEEYGLETLGIVRPPLYNLIGNHGRTGGGLALFIRNRFPGNGLLQLLTGLTHAGLFSKEELLADIRWSLAPRDGADEDVEYHDLCNYFEKKCCLKN